MPVAADDTNSLLREIRDNLKLIAAAMAEPLRKRLSEEFLTSPQRQKMYKEFDGEHTYEQVAKKVGVTHEAVRMLAVTLQHEGFLAIEKKDAKSFPRRLL
jgi:hypothetical protein